MDTNKIVLEDKCLEFLAIMENYNLHDKFDPNRPIAKAYKDTSRTVLEEMCPEFQVLREKGKC
jgi:hypothetical protein